MDDNQIAEIVARVLRERRASESLSHIEVSSDTDFDGTPIIRVMAHYDRRLDTDAGVLIDAIHEIRTELLKHGEDRFVFMSSSYRDEPKYDAEDVG